MPGRDFGNTRARSAPAHGSRQGNEARSSRQRPLIRVKREEERRGQLRRSRDLQNIERSMTACLGPRFGEQLGLDHDRIQICRSEFQPARAEIGVERPKDRAGGRPMQCPAKDREADGIAELKRVLRRDRQRLAQAGHQGEGTGRMRVPALEGKEKARVATHHQRSPRLAARRAATCRRPHRGSLDLSIR